MPDRNSSDFTTDRIYSGQLSLVQPRTGYRFAFDSLLLSYFARVEPGQTIVDLGTGSGIVALSLAKRMKSGRVIGIEIQPRLAECARTNVRSNGLESLVEILEMNWSDLTGEKTGGPIAHAVCNPPYRGLGTGRINPDDESALARHEIAGSLASAAQAAAGVLEPKGLFTAVYPAARLAGLLNELNKCGLEPKRLRLVHSRPGEKAILTVVEARLGGGEELEVCPPLFVYEKGRRYSTEAQNIISGRFLA